MLWDTSIESKYREKVDHYKDLAIELSRLWQKHVTIIPIIVNSLGCVKSNLYKALKDPSIEAERHSYTLQKTAVSPQHISWKEFLISTGSAPPSGFPYPVLQTCNVHVLWNLNIIIIIIAIIIIGNYDGDSEVPREACLLHLRLIIRDCWEADEGRSKFLALMFLS